MKKIIDGVIYNESTSKMICCDEYGNAGDFSHCCETLYMTKKGNFFRVGEGGALSKYAESCGQNQTCGGEEFEPLTTEDAMEFVEKHGTSEDVDTLTKILEKKGVKLEEA